MQLLSRQTEGQSTQGPGGQGQGPPPKGPPYASRLAALGGIPKVTPDVPISAVFIVLFLLAAAGHMTLFQLNRKRGHKFIVSAALFGFCMVRTISAVLRIVWACRQQNTRVAIAATIFVTIGNLIGFIVNILFAQRIVRATHPRWGWHRAFDIFLIMVLCAIPISLSILIGFIILSYYTLDMDKLLMSRDVGYYGATFFGFMAILPLLIILAVLLIPRKTPTENFGTGTFHAKLMILLFGSLTLSTGAWFRAGTSYLPPRMLRNPAPYQSKACFYVFYYTLEILVLWTYLLLRVDRRFWVPNGSKGPGDYSKSVETKNEEETSMEMGKQSHEEGKRSHEEQEQPLV